MTHEPSSQTPPPRPPAPQPAQQQPSFARRPPAFLPWATYSLLGITIGVFLLQALSLSLSGRDYVAALGWKQNDLIAQGQLWRLVTPMFLHGSILHIGFNMYALFVLGPGLERHYGHVRFLILYGLSGFAGNVLSMAFSTAPSLGSSTAVFGLLGAQGVFMYQNQELLGALARRALNNIILIAVINLVIGLSPQIDNWGHIGGLMGGTMFAWLAGPVFRVEGLFPAVDVKDTRGEGDVFRAALLVGVSFSLLAAGAILLN